MLLDKYLPQYQFSEKHSILIKSSPAKIFELADKLDMSGSIIIRLLYRLRGMSSNMLHKEGLQKNKFLELQRIDQREIIIGVIGQFWKPRGNIEVFNPDEFIPFQAPGFAKAVWNFEIIHQGESEVLLTTETRVQCLDQQCRKKFSRYWFFIRPFSGLIRKEMLRTIKKKAEQI